MKHPLAPVALSGLALLASVSSASAQRSSDRAARLWQDLPASAVFQARGLRCGTPPYDPAQDQGAFPASDCAYGSTNPTSAYDPNELYEIQVVFHVIQNSSGAGFVSQTQIQNQIDVLNEDFLALAGSNGANGNDGQIQFKLATVDPNGSPTSGVTYSTNDSWYNDNGNYWATLAWDPNRYMNVYTNSAGGYLGYVPDIPQGLNVGSKSDRVVVYWKTVGKATSYGPPYNWGRTLTHEVGHYLGLYHTFDGGCGSASACYTTGDRICDTNQQQAPQYGCPNTSSCGSVDPRRNYMNYTDDLCMWEFTNEQIRRMRCTLEFWRPNVFTVAGPLPPSSYCTAKITTNLCFPQIAWSGLPSATGAGTFDITASSTINLKNGLLFYGYGQAALPFQGGILCVNPPLRRTSIQNSGGNPPPDDCSGSFAYDMNALIASGLDPLLVAGSTADAQYWFRDNADPNGTGLTDAVEFTVFP